MNKKLILFIISILILPICFSIDYVLPTKISGQILSKNIPVENFEVTAHWIDVQNELQSTSTMTLDKDEARRLGDSSLKGYYFFDNIRALPNTNIIIDISQTKHNFIIPSNPGHSVQVTTISLNFDYMPIENGIYNLTVYEEENQEDILGLINSINTSEEIIEDEKNTVPEINITKKATIEEKIKDSPESRYNNAENDKQNKIMKDLLNALMILLFITIGIVVLYFSVRLTTKYFSNIVSNITLSPIKASSKKILNKKIREFSAPTEKISKNDTVYNALNKIMSSKKDTLFVVENDKCIGKISEKEIFKMDINKNMSELKVIDLMSENIALIEDDKTLEEAYYLIDQEETDCLGVIDNGNLVGEITILNMLKQTSSFSGDNSKSNNIRYLMKKSFISLDKKENIKNARQKMIENHTKFVITTENNNPVGIFTIRDYIEALSKYEKNIFNNNVEHVMSSSISSIIPDISVFKAIKIMLEKGFKNYAVKYENEILGIITQKKVLDTIISIMQKELNS